MCTSLLNMSWAIERGWDRSIFNIKWSAPALFTTVLSAGFPQPTSSAEREPGRGVDGKQQNTNEYLGSGKW